MPSDIELAKEFKVNRSTIFRWRKDGMPSDDLESARAWVEGRRRDIGKDAVPIPVDGETAYDVRDRLRAQEQMIAGEIRGLDFALQQARNRNDDKGAYKLLQSLKSAREEHRRQTDALLKAEGRIIQLEKTRGSLIGLDAAKEFVTATINPISIWLRKLSDSGRNEDEKKLLSELGEAGLAIIRGSATQAINYSGANT